MPSPPPPPYGPPLPPYSPPPPPNYCAYKREMLQLYFDQQKAKVQPIRDRYAAGTGHDSRLAALNCAYCVGEGVEDPADCCGRSISALAAAQTWMEQFDLTVPPAETACQTALNEMCSYLDWQSAAAEAEAKVNNYAIWLDNMDQQLAQMEAYWAQMSRECPVPPY